MEAKTRWISNLRSMPRWDCSLRRILRGGALALAAVLLAGVHAGAQEFMPDPFEDDDSADTSTWIAIDDAEGQRHNFDSPSDEDWLQFWSPGGEILTLSTFDLGSASDTFLEVFAPDGVTRLDFDDNGGVGAASFLLFMVDAPGLYFVRITHAAEGFGLNTDYSVSIIREIGIISGNLVVTVASASGSTPIAGAVVRLPGLGGAFIDTDAEGRALFPALPEGPYTVEASAEGFESAMGQATVLDQQTAQLPLLLVENAPMLPEDINGSGQVDAVDVQLVINGALNLNTQGFVTDIDESGSTDARDIQLVINEALNL